MSLLVRVTVACLTVAAASAVLAAEGTAAKPAAPAAKPAAAKPAAAAPAKAADDKLVYALGVYMSSSIRTFSFTEAEIEQLKAGLVDGLHGKGPTIDLQTYGPKFQALQQERLPAFIAKEKEAGKAFADKAATQAGAKKTATGIVITTVKEGTGASPVATDQVKVHYEGKLTNGAIFDSSIKRNEPATFPLNGVIPCWTEAVQTMKVGGKAKLICPSDLAYGDNGRPPQIPPAATLVFDVELLEIVKAPPPAPAPAPAPTPPPK